MNCIFTKRNRSIFMKILNRNRANILLLFTRDPFAKATTEELEYYTSDDEVLLGVVARDRIDGTFHACLLDRDSRRKYCLVGMAIDCDTIAEARQALKEKKETYVRNDAALQRKDAANDFFLLLQSRSNGILLSKC